MAVTALGPDLFPGVASAAVPGSLAKITALVSSSGKGSGGFHWCALAEEKTAWCWGGLVTTETGVRVPSVIGRRVPGPDGTGALTDVKAIAGGADFTCALKTDGSVWCWGLNDKGQLGNESTVDSANPVKVSSSGGLAFGGIDKLDAGTAHVCAVKAAGGEVFCWGDNLYSALGAGSLAVAQSTTPTPVTGANGAGTLSGATSISVGSWSACITKADHSVWCWGFDRYGQLGDNQPYTNHGDGQLDRAYAVQVVGVGGTGSLSATEVSAGLYQACAVGTDGVVYCWGIQAPGDYRINNPATTNQDHYWGAHAPIANPGLDGTGVLTGVTGLGGSWHHYCGVTADHFASCWGDNPNNVLLDGSGAAHPWPSKSTIGGISSIAPGGEASSALFDGVAKCWGTNSAGELGDGSTGSRPTPAPVTFVE